MAAAPAQCVCGRAWRASLGETVAAAEARRLSTVEDLQNLIAPNTVSDDQEDVSVLGQWYGAPRPEAGPRVSEQPPGYFSGCRVCQLRVAPHGLADTGCRLHWRQLTVQAVGGRPNAPQ